MEFGALGRPVQVQSDLIQGQSSVGLDFEPELVEVDC